MSVTIVLLAEDDLDDQAFFRGFLQHRPDIHILPIAENGIVLFETLDTITDDNHLPHLIILDQNMPKRNGLQTLQLLKATTRYAGIPVIVYSTYADDKLIDECLDSGALNVITKPITREGYNHIIDVFIHSML